MDRASIDTDIGPFAEFIAARVKGAIVREDHFPFALTFRDFLLTQVGAVAIIGPASKSNGTADWEKSLEL